LFDIINTKDGFGLMFTEVQQKLLGLVEPSEDVNNDVLLRIGHKSLIDLDPSMYPMPIFLWLYYANHHCDSLLHFSQYRKGMSPAMVNSALLPCTKTFEFRQDRFEIIRVTYNGEDDKDLVVFPADAEVFVNYNMSIPNFKCGCGSKKCMSWRSDVV
jgi:hypothetical protein